MFELSLILLTILLSGFFSGSEIAFISANRLKLEIESRKKSLIGRSVNYFIRNPETFLTTTLVGNNIVNVVYATLMTLFLAAPITVLYQNWFGQTPSPMTMLSIQTILASVVIMIFGEILPKALFRIHSDWTVRLISVPQQIFHWLFKPLIIIADIASDFIIRLINPEIDRTGQVFRRQDVELIFKELRDTGGSDLDKEDSEILHNVLELSNKRVKESMIPRTDMVAIEKNTSIEETLKVFISSGFSKLPVYQETIDDIVGVIFAHDLFNNPTSLSEIMRPIKLVPPSQRSKDLLSEFRKSNLSVAIVIDEYGGTAGMVTIEDLLEEVVGDIQDEYDTKDQVMKKLSPNTYVLSGNVEIEDLMEAYPEIILPEESANYETVAGYIINSLGRIPKVNEELLIDGNRFIISKASPSRIENVKLILGNEQ
ncbi:hemolysin family protein [Aliifodinibius sp. S!AR15-10]|uniref:hemolysin family protein n=1 Tax=Aliifodinibius sp. S!AR15-10 TaxID=2950437 RepID=UPI0028554415|nr:hemolysin family protein [Aliifodinibius sp. S!AR15-10]MDR8389750.1 hemolysin family protein [Aliifodinibius sp. S!AR15-10]